MFYSYIGASTNINYTFNPSGVIDPNPDSIANTLLYRKYPTQLVTSGIIPSFISGSTYTIGFTIPQTFEPGEYYIKFSGVVFDGNLPVNISQDISVFWPISVQNGDIYSHDWSQIFLPRAYFYNKAFKQHPETWYITKDFEHFTTSGIDLFSTIPSGLDYYIFPINGVEVDNFYTNHNKSEFLNFYKLSGAKVGITIPTHSVYVYPSGQQVSTAIGNVQSYFNSIPSSWENTNEGGPIYTDEGKRLFKYHDNSVITIVTAVYYSRTISTGYDFVLFDQLEVFPSGLQDGQDPTLDFENWGWSGTLPFTQETWLTRQENFTSNSSNYFILQNTDRVFKTSLDSVSAQKLHFDSAGSIVSGMVLEDLDWYEGEIWDLITKIKSTNSKVFLTMAYLQDCPDWLATLGKAICIMTDSVYSPGYADHLNSYNISSSLYTKYNLGDAVSDTYREGNIIKRDFTNGYVQIIDDGSFNISTIFYTHDSGYDIGTIYPIDVTYRLQSNIEDTWTGPIIGPIDQAWVDYQEGFKISGLHAPQKIVDIDATLETVTYSGNWPDGTFENGYFDDSTYWYTNGPNYLASRPRVRRTAEYGTGYIYGNLAGFNFNGRDTYRMLAGYEWLRDHEQIYKDPPGSFRTGLMCDGGYVSWIYRPDQEVPNDESNRFLDTNNPIDRNEAANNWFDTGRVVDFMSKYYAWSIQNSGINPNPSLLAPIQIACNNMINKGSNFRIVNSTTDPDWGYTDPQTGQTDYQPNINYHAQALIGLVSAYKINAIYQVDTNSTVYTNLLTNENGLFANVSSGIVINNLVNVIDGSDDTAMYLTNTASGLLFNIGVDLGVNQEKEIYKYIINPDSNNPNKRPKSWELLATQDDSIWYPIDYRTNQNLSTTNINEFIVQNPGRFKKYKLSFYEYEASDYTYISKIEFIHATPSQEKALEVIENLTWEIVNIQDTNENSPLRGNFYQSDIGGSRVDSVNGQLFYHDTSISYHPTNTYSLVCAYQVATSVTLRQKLRYAIRLAIDDMITNRLTVSGLLSTWTYTTTGDPATGANATSASLHTKMPEMLGNLILIMQSEPTFWEEEEIEKVKRFMKATATPLDYQVAIYFEPSMAYKVFYDAITE